MIENKIGTRNWSETEIDQYVGPHLQTYFSYATDDHVRNGAASGGSVTAIFIHLLETGVVQGVLAVRTLIIDGNPSPEFFIAQTKQELLNARGSKYSAVAFVRQGLPLIQSFEGDIAVVLLPCDAKILRATRQKDLILNRKIKLVISLVCGHNSEPELVQEVVKKIRGERGELVDYVYRQGHWRGELQATFENGDVVKKPFSTFSDYQNLYCFAQRKCHHCSDHFGQFSDLSAGDIWSPRMKQETIKHTALIVRTETGQSIVDSALAAGDLHASLEPVEEVCDGQARTLPFHYNTTARARVGKLLGIRIKDKIHAKVRWHDYLIALIAMTNQRITATRFGRKVVMMIPRPIIRGYLYFFKALESI